MQRKQSEPLRVVKVRRSLLEYDGKGEAYEPEKNQPVKKNFEACGILGHQQSSLFTWSNCLRPAAILAACSRISFAACRGFIS
jgi:hypothetical protein